MYSNGFVVSVKINGVTVGEKDNFKVAMPFDTEYSLMLKNRNDRKAVAKVYIDGEEVTKTGKLILDANSTLNLERYIEDMDNGAKFKFVPLSNNEVKDEGDSEKGFIEVRFQLVKPTQSQVIMHEEHIYHHKHHYNDYWDYPVYKGPFYYCGGVGNSASSSGLNVNNTVSGNFTSLNCNSLATNSNDTVSYNAKIEDNKLIEEVGATIKGSNSSQKFSYSYVGELESQETVIRFQLVGTKDKETIKLYKKTHCTKCGKKYDVNDKYCSDCGEQK
jgi:hypothetical protein